jgi:nitrile hydratase accessory protein
MWNKNMIVGLPESPAVFAEPWQAHAFALAVRLSEAGCFTWPEWTEALSEEIQDAQRQDEGDPGSAYYRHWLSALERLCARKGIVAMESMRQRQEEWRRAYLNTPHGQPVSLDCPLPGGRGSDSL